VRVSDFTELKLIVKDLAIAQQRTEARVAELTAAQQRTETRVGELTAAQERLAKAQQRTETRVAELVTAQQRTETRVAELAAAQQRTETRVAELAAAQQRTETRVTELAAAQQRTETRVAELAAAQQRTEVRMEAMAATVQRLVEEQREMRQEIGGLAMTVGYGLENEAYRALPALLARDHNLELQGQLKRAYVTNAQGRALEVNILGTARRDGQEITIVGESKAQLSKNKVDQFLARRLLPLKEIFPQVFPVLITHMISEPDAETYARAAGIAVYYSYDF
jgi:hypothetical protein